MIKSGDIKQVSIDGGIFEANETTFEPISSAKKDFTAEEIFSVIKRLRKLAVYPPYDLYDLVMMELGEPGRIQIEESK